MPNVTIFIPAAQMPSDQALTELTERCTVLCTQGLQASLAHVHIVYVAVRHGRGHPVFAEVRYRLASLRTPAVMEAFMEGLEEAICKVMHMTPRIRCFGYAASNIYARN